MFNYPTVLKYIDPMTDYGFKKIFKNENHKRLMRELLCNVFDPQIIEIEFVDSEHLGETEDDRRAYFDVECSTSDGKRFVVEVQLRDQKFFPERAILLHDLPDKRTSNQRNMELRLPAGSISGSDELRYA